MKVTKKLEAAHIEQFKLEANPEKGRTEKIFRNFPPDWPDISKAKNLQWFAWPYNRDDGSNLQLWSVMVLNGSTLYFFHQNYDVTP